MSLAPGVIRFPLASPPAYPGTALTAALNTAFAGTATLFQGSVPPTAIALGLDSLAGILWHDTSLLPGSSALWIRNQADDAWILLGTLNEVLNVFNVTLLTSLRALTSTSPSLAVIATDNLGQIEIDAAANGNVGPLTVEMVPANLPAPMQVTFFKTDSGLNPVYISNGTTDIYVLSQQNDSVQISSNGAVLRPIGTPPNV